MGWSIALHCTLYWPYHSRYTKLQIQKYNQNSAIDTKELIQTQKKSSSNFHDSVYGFSQGFHFGDCLAVCERSCAWTSPQHVMQYISPYVWYVEISRGQVYFAIKPRPFKLSEALDFADLFALEQKCRTRTNNQVSALKTYYRTRKTYTISVHIKQKR